MTFDSLTALNLDSFTSSGVNQIDTFDSFTQNFKPNGKGQLGKLICSQRQVEMRYSND